MNTATIVLLILALAVAVFYVPSRVRGGRTGAGQGAQLAFRRAHGERVAELLGPEDVATPERPNSPWMDIAFGGRHARMVAAPIAPGVMQAGVELTDWQIPVQIWFTDGSTDELDVPVESGMTVDDVLEVVHALRALGVDSVAAPRPDALHIMRVRFSDVGELATTLAQIAPILEQLSRPMRPSAT